jgi:hypothetical protein
MPKKEKLVAAEEKTKKLSKEDVHKRLERLTVLDDPEDAALLRRIDELMDIPGFAKVALSFLTVVEEDGGPVESVQGMRFALDGMEANQEAYDEMASLPYSQLVALIFLSDADMPPGKKLKDILKARAQE